MPKSTFTNAYASFTKTLIELRKEAGLSQVELAARLQKPQQFVSRYELGIRRLDVVEFYAIARALGVDPSWAFARTVKAFPLSVVI